MFPWPSLWNHPDRQRSKPCSSEKSGPQKKLYNTSFSNTSSQRSYPFPNIPEKEYRRAQGYRVPHRRYTLLDCAYGGGAHGSREHGGDTGISTQSLKIRKKECEYFLFDFIPRDLKSSTAVQNYIGEELRLPTLCIMIESHLPRGGWEAWIDKKMNLARVVQLPLKSMYSSPRNIADWGYLWKSFSPTD